VIEENPSYNCFSNSSIIYKVIDISKKENGQIADKYEVTWSSLFVNGWKDNCFSNSSTLFLIPSLNLSGDFLALEKLNSVMLFTFSFAL